MVDSSAETWNNAGVSVIRMHENDDVSKGIALKNKVGQQKSTYDFCDSKKSNFLKPIKSIKKKVLTNYKMLTYCSKCEKHTDSVCSKKLIMMTNVKLKEYQDVLISYGLRVIMTQFLIH